MCQLKDCGKNPLGLYRVQEGDTLQSVCARFALPPALVAARNGLRAFPPAGALLLLPDERLLVRLSDAARSRGGGVGLTLSQSGSRASYIGL